MDLTKNLRQRCHVNTNEDGDSFVGVKADTDDAVIYFPIGYQLPDKPKYIHSQRILDFYLYQA